MSTTSDVRPVDVPPPEPSPAGLIHPERVRRLIGAVLIAGIVGAFFMTTDFPRLDVVREDVAIATAVDVARSGVPADQVSNCFQGFCFEDDVGFAQRWWEFSTTYLRLVWSGLAVAFIVAGVVDGFLLPTSRGPAYGTWATASPETRAELGATSLIPTRGRAPATTALLVGGLGGPAIAMSVVLFTPAVWLTRLGLALFVLVPLLAVARVASRVTAEPVVRGSVVGELGQGARAALAATWRFTYRLAPLFVVSAFLGGLGTQYLTVDGVETFAGGHVLGVLLAVLVGIVLDLPLTFGLPLAALALVVGADPVVAGVLLVTATLTGPGALRRLWRAAGRDRLVGLATGLLLLIGSVVALSVADFALAATSGPTIAWDGETCSYRGPVRFGPGIADFTIRNDAEDLGEGHTMAIVVGKLPANVTLDHFAATVAADPTAPLPSWFTVAGTEEFIFPGTEAGTEITFHDPGTYAAVCLDGGGFYVIFEFSMPQPMGWFDEFRSTFDGYVAEETFTVAG